MVLLEWMGPSEMWHEMHSNTNNKKVTKALRDTLQAIINIKMQCLRMPMIFSHSVHVHKFFL